jgi:hypothetical protein
MFHAFCHAGATPASQHHREATDLLRNPRDLDFGLDYSQLPIKRTTLRGFREFVNQRTRPIIQAGSDLTPRWFRFDLARVKSDPAHEVFLVHTVTNAERDRARRIPDRHLALV